MDIQVVQLLPIIIGVVAVFASQLSTHFGHFWHNTTRRILFAIGLSIAAVMAVVAFSEDMHLTQEHLTETGLEAVLLILFVVADYINGSGVRLKGDLKSDPTSLAMLIMMAYLTSPIMSTVGSTLLFGRIFALSITERKYVFLPIVAFIPVVCNFTGGFSPAGDPPLTLLKLLGVPATWSLQMFLIMLLVGTTVTLLYWVSDRAYFWPREGKARRSADVLYAEPIRIDGWKSYVSLALMPLASFFVVFTPMWIAIPAMLLIAAGGYAFSRENIMKNDFSWDLALDVAPVMWMLMFAALSASTFFEHHINLVAPFLKNEVTTFIASAIGSAGVDNAPWSKLLVSAVAEMTHQGLIPAYRVVEQIGVPHWHLISLEAGAVIGGAWSGLGNFPNILALIFFAHVLGGREMHAGSQEDGESELHPVFEEVPSFASYTFVALPFLSMISITIVGSYITIVMWLERLMF